MSIENFDPNGVGLKNGNFIGLPFTAATANLILYPVPWDVTVSFAEGTSSGPENILSCSSQLDLYDPDILDAWKLGVYFAPIPEKWKVASRELRPEAKQYIDFLESGAVIAHRPDMQERLDNINQNCFQLKEEVKKEIRSYLDQGKIVGLVGGDHSTPLGYLEALAERYPEFSVLQIDAHHDLREAYEGFTYSHASISWNALKIPNIGQLVQAGIRDYCESEAKYAQEHPRVKVFYDRDIKEQQFRGQTFHQTCLNIIASLGKEVYISFDIDGLQPAYCPNTGTPVPGGFQYEEAIYLLKLLVESGRKIIGFDLNEVAGTGNDWDGNVGARVLWQLSIWAGRSQGLI